MANGTEFAQRAAQEFEEVEEPIGNEMSIPDEQHATEFDVQLLPEDIPAWLERLDRLGLGGQKT